MSVKARKIAIALTCLVFVCAMAGMNTAESQEPHRDIPANAHSSAGEQGWACNNGFRQVAGLCMEDRDAVPSWGAFEVFDGQWRCRTGYHRDGSYCVPAVAPAHATYVGGGDHWECDWGFQKIGSRCEEIKPPAHAYVDAAGHDWVCYPGFERRADRCVPGAGVAPAGDGAPTRSEAPGAEGGSPQARR
jgi:hypothetical protein